MPRSPLSVALVAVVAGCAHAPWQASAPVTGSTACLAAMADDFPTKARPLVIDELTKSGLAEQAAALSPTLTEILPADRVEALRRASADGRCRRIRYRVDGLDVVGFVLEPANAAPRSLPAILYARGGNREFGKNDFFQLALLQTFADAGFVVATTQYRGVDGGGGRDQFGGDDVRDLEALFSVVRTLPAHDRQRVYLFGHSRGGMEAYEALRDGLPVRAAAVAGGPVDLAKMLQDRPEMARMVATVVPDWGTAQHEAVEHRSAIRWADRLGAPLLLVHARQDWRVPIGHSLAMDATLTRIGKEHKLVVIDGDAHQLFLHLPQLVAEIVTWFRAHP